MRRPHEFKIACLQDIRALFPADWNPFYAGFGNRDTDEVAYRCGLALRKQQLTIVQQHQPQPAQHASIQPHIAVRPQQGLSNDCVRTPEPMGFGVIEALLRSDVYMLLV